MSTEFTSDLRAESMRGLASIIEREWPKVSAHARPYLDAMRQVTYEETEGRKIWGRYYEDDGRSMVLYFLSNASGWRGPVARQVKAELKRRCGIK